MRTSRKNLYEINIWPGFVDVLGTLLIVTIFTVLISTVTQIYFNDQLEIKRGEISSLDNQITNLADQLNLLNIEKKKIEKRFSKLTIQFKELDKKKIMLDEDLSKSQYNLKVKGKELDQIVNERSNLLEKIQKQNEDLNNLGEIKKRNDLEIFELNRNVEKLNKRLSELSKLLISSEEEDKRNKVKIENLGKKLNQALAGKLQELSEYQSIFFKKIKEALGDRTDIKVQGDRFIFPSEIFFESGSDVIQVDGVQKLTEIAKSLKEISEKIPSKIDWVLRIDGHTDKVPISNEKFNSNWHLSSSRAINIVKLLIENEIPSNRLVAAGFGEHSPLINQESNEAYKKNRRIEIKLTRR
ncbi:MAG: peptidoglycan -binding protein [Pseudomonadota bacterium]|nr:peptidoglycan -binding protein [Pseudomonadota bacterium]